MKRIDKIYHQLLDNFRESTINQLLKVQGNSAKEIAQQLQMERSNVSFELNNLVRSKKVIKVKTFPVRYVRLKQWKKRSAANGIQTIWKWKS